MGVPSGVGTVSPVPRPTLPDGVVSACVPASNPAVLTPSLVKVIGTALPVSATVAEAKLCLATATVTLALIKSVEAAASVMGILTAETESALNTMVSLTLLLVSMVTEVSVVPLAMTLFGVVVQVSSVLPPYSKGVVVLCVTAGAVLAEILASVANEPPVSILAAVPKRLSAEAEVVSDVEVAAAVSLTMSVCPPDEGEALPDAGGPESLAAVRKERLH